MTNTATLTITDDTDVDIAQALLRRGHRVVVEGDDLLLLLQAVRGFGAPRATVVATAPARDSVALAA
ncbi:MAG: hypothetical protein PGN29_17315 [Gordonia paraffinivorans]